MSLQEVDSKIFVNVICVLLQIHLVYRGWVRYQRTFFEFLRSIADVDGNKVITVIRPPRSSQVTGPALGWTQGFQRACRNLVHSSFWSMSLCISH